VSILGSIKIRGQADPQTVLLRPVDVPSQLGCPQNFMLSK